MIADRKAVRKREKIYVNDMRKARNRKKKAHFECFSEGSEYDSDSNSGSDYSDTES